MHGATRPANKAFSQRDRRKDSSSSSFGFVNVVPETEEERINLRSAVRANATRYLWRESRVTRSSPAVTSAVEQRGYSDPTVPGYDHVAHSHTLSSLTNYDYGAGLSQY
jgi:hypothetical protein